MLATVCGIEPNEPGFKTVRVAPHLGALEFARGSVPHSSGMIEVDLQNNDDGGLRGAVVLPENLTGVFLWEDQTIPLAPGANPISLQQTD
jgi:hypothetical protein